MPSRTHPGFVSTRLAILLIAIFASLIVGCREDEKATITDPPPTQTDLSNPDGVYLHYEDVYGLKDIDQYRRVLDGEFQFVETQLGTYDHGTEIIIMNNIFTGRPGQDGLGNLESPITSIDFQLTPVGAWQDIPAGDEYFGGTNGQWRYFTLQAVFERAADVRLEVSGQVRMYVKQIEVEGEKEFRVLGFRDSTSAKLSGNSSWTEVKNLFRSSG